MATTASNTEHAGSGGPARSFRNRLVTGDRVAHLIALLVASSIVFVTAWLVLELYTNSSMSRHQFGWGFLTSQVWDPVNDQYGALPFIYGTLVTSALALLVAVPFGVGAAIFLAELAPPRISDALTFLIELLAAVPSVIFGLIGIFVLVPMLKAAEPAIRATLGFLPFF